MYYVVYEIICIIVNSLNMILRYNMGSEYYILISSSLFVAAVHCHYAMLCTVCVFFLLCWSHGVDRLFFVGAAERIHKFDTVACINSIFQSKWYCGNTHTHTNGTPVV